MDLTIPSEFGFDHNAIIRGIFSRGVTGNLSEPWNQGTLFQTTDTSTPVTAVEQGIGRISDTSGSGNHLIQATGASEPVWSKRYNRILNSQNFSALWTLSNVALGAATTDPFGGSNAVKVIASAILGTHLVHQTGISYTNGEIDSESFYVKGGGGITWVALRSDYPADRYASFNVATGAVGAKSASCTSSIESAGNGWYRCTISWTSNAAGLGSVYLSVNNTDTASAESWTPVGTEYIELFGGQLNYGSTALPYQRIAAATDYDTAGFLPYAKFDGVDDNWTCATGGGSTTAFSLQIAVMLEGAAAAQTIWSDAGANTGLKIERDASNQIVFSGGNGAAFVPATSAALTVGTAYVITCTYDGTTLSIQINNGTPVTAACALSAGTAGFTVGKENGASSKYFLGRCYGMIYAGKNYLMSDAEKLAGKQLLAAKAGISL